jgi:hypothetical protein
MKLLTIFWGESYRSGSMGSRSRGQNDYMKRQLLASESHTRCINKLKEMGHSVDTILFTYQLNDNDDSSLLNYYRRHTNIIKAVFHEKLYPDERALFDGIFQSLKPHLPHYDGLMWIRLDFYLKKYFIEHLNPKLDKIQISHIDCNLAPMYFVESFQICHNIVYLPKQFFYVIQNDILNRAEHPHRFKDIMILNGISLYDIHYMIDTLHVCSTDMGWNPLYIQVGRAYSREYHTGIHRGESVNYYYDEEKHQFMYDPSKTVEKWKPYLNEDNLEDNLEALPYSHLDNA